MQFFDNITSTPKKRVVTLVGLGCLATLSLPPFFWLPLLFVSTCGWLSLLMRAETPGQAFRTGWWWGLGFFVSGLYWTSISLLVDAERFAWMIPFALFGLNGFIAIFPGLACWGWFYLYHSSPHRGEVRRGASNAELCGGRPHPNPPPKGEGIVKAALLFTICWSISEFARSVLLTGFPWNLVGYAWGDWISAMQLASLVGIHGLTLATILLSLIPILYKRGETKLAINILFAWMLIIAWGMWRVDNTPTEASTDQPTVRVVQAAIPQSLKWDPKEKINGIHKHIKLTHEAEGDADIIVWPESAVPIAINKEPVLENDLKSMLVDHQLLITGSIKVMDSPIESFPHKKPVPFRVYNSVYTLDKTGTLHIYDKHHLVPFGEFVPLRSILPVDKITPGDMDYSRGPGPQTVKAKSDALTFSPLVCYEAIFSDEVLAENDARPDYMVNVTNDAWFGDSTGPYQHLHMTRFRTVEQGIPLIRAANTGISAVIDSVGRLVDSIELHQYGTIDVKLPNPLSPTLYSSIGNWGYVFMILLLLLNLKLYAGNRDLQF